MNSLETLELFSRFHPRWFESIDHYNPSDEYLTVIKRDLPSDWSLERQGLFYFVSPEAYRAPAQGWKIHISSTTKHSCNILEIVVQQCVELNVAFKCTLDFSITALFNGKIWPRESSGKFVTLYPSNLDLFYRIGARVSAALHENQGPYILSDRPWPGSKSVFYRYGGFTPKPALQLDGTKRYTIRDPLGNERNDERNPYWQPPGWVRDPFPASYDSEEVRLALKDGRYEIEGAITFSNRGGVYKARDTQYDSAVLIKEFRPLVEVGARGVDSFDIMEKEVRLLRSLERSPYFVDCIDTFFAWEHGFIVEKFVSGVEFGHYTIARNPLLSLDISAETIRDYLRNLAPLWEQIVLAVDVAHNYKITMGDLSFSNILVSGEDIKICDLETAIQDNCDRFVGLSTPGMSDPRLDRYANDYFALGALLLGSIMLLQNTVQLNSVASRRILDNLRVDLGLPTTFVDLIYTLLNRPTEIMQDRGRINDALEVLRTTGKGHSFAHARLARPMRQRFGSDKLRQLRKEVEETVQGIVEYAVGESEPKRVDRLFPADPHVFFTNPMSISYGAMGVVRAIKQITGDVPSSILDWILKRPVNSSDYPPGLYKGWSGIAWVFCEVAQQEHARQIYYSCRGHQVDWKVENIIHGSAGYGLACLKLYQILGDKIILDDAIEVGERIYNAHSKREGITNWINDEESTPVGYATGASGIALFMLRLSQVTARAKYKDVGRTGLDFDLGAGVFENGVLAGFPARVQRSENDEARRRVLHSYWHTGSAGIGTTTIEYLKDDYDATLEVWLERIVAEVSRKYTVFPSLFLGGAGLGNFLLDAWYYSGNESHLLAAWHVAEGILLSRIMHKHGVAFPGDQARRESVDFATGSAGIGLFLDRLSRAEDAYMPNFNFMLDGRA